MSEKYGEPSEIVCAVRGQRLWMWCPGCDDLHAVTLDGWQVDTSDLDRPTVSPSILVHQVTSADGQVYIPRCHSFLRAGRWEFLTDCDHALAGQTVDMVPLPLWFVRQDQP